MTAGRPAIPFDQQLADQICEMIATTELGLEEVLARLKRKRVGKKTPGLTTIYNWLRDNVEFAKQSAHARKLQASLLHDLAQKYAREPMVGRIVRKENGPDGRKTIETISDNVERSKLLVQTTLRRAGQLDPKKYGESMTLKGDSDNPIQLNHSAEDLIAKIMGSAMAKPSSEPKE